MHRLHVIILYEKQKGYGRVLRDKEVLSGVPLYINFFIRNDGKKRFPGGTAEVKFVLYYGDLYGITTEKQLEICPLDVKKSSNDRNGYCSTASWVLGVQDKNYL